MPVSQQVLADPGRGPMDLNYKPQAYNGGGKGGSGNGRQTITSGYFSRGGDMKSGVMTVEIV